MKILVTGGAGFIGSHIVDKLVAEEHQVSVVDNLSMGLQRNVNKKAKFYKADITDAKTLLKIFQKEEPEIVNHHAAHNNLARSFVNPLLDANVNINGTINVIRAAQEVGTRKIIYPSSGGISYGMPKKLPTTEEYPIDPTGPYGLSKHIAELYLQLLCKNTNTDFTILRYGSVYGPRQNPNNEVGVVAIFINKLLQNKRPTIFGDGKQTRDFIFVGDVVEANTLAIENGSRETFHIATQKETSILELFTNLKKLTNSDVEPIFADTALGEFYRCCLNIEHARKKLGWKPRYTLEAGSKKTVEYFRGLL